jgi:hypothetical protein
VLTNANAVLTPEAQIELLIDAATSIVDQILGSA